VAEKRDRAEDLKTMLMQEGIDFSNPEGWNVLPNKGMYINIC
jgi:hypothetical protein